MIETRDAGHGTRKFFLSLMSFNCGLALESELARLLTQALPFVPRFSRPAAQVL
jgi:hypothetical protein